MPRLATVHAIDGPSRAELLRDEIFALIESGTALPGQTFSIRAVAELRGVRASTLTQLLSGLRSHHFLTLHGDTATVAPISMDSAMKALQLRRDLERHLLARSAYLSTPARLNRLARSLPDPGDRTLTTIRFSEMLTEFELSLHRPGGTRMETEMLGEIHRNARRSICLANRSQAGGINRLFGSEELLRKRVVGLSFATIEEMRSGRVSSIHEMRTEYQDDYEMFAQLATDLNHPTVETEFPLSPPPRVDGDHDGGKVLQFRPRH